MAPCPDLESYAALAAGAAPPAEAESLLAHLETCAECAKRVETLGHSNTLLDEMRRRADVDNQPSGEAIVQEIIAQARDLGARSPSLPITQPALDLLAPAQMPDEIGRLGRYRVLRVLGRGGMGVVFEADEPELQRRVALKVILSGSYASAEQRARFRTEAAALARLQHANIVHIYEVGDHAGTLFFAMEVVGGGTLATKLGGRPMPPKAAAELIVTMARAVQVAHERGIIHRDLKPSNILLAEDGSPKISDFGLAKHVDAVVQHTQTDAILGTPNYMAPEQARRQVGAFGAATDVYALGAILFEMLVGHPPFQGPDSYAVVEQVLREDPVPLRRLQPRIPRDLETICLKCLQKAPARRYASAADLADDLQRCLTNHPIRARPIGWLERALKWARRHPTRASMAGVAVVLVSAGVALTIGFARYLQAALDQRTDELKVLQDQREQESRENQERIRKNLYLSDMRFAIQQWQSGDWQGVRALLEGHIPKDDQADLRGFEWAMLRRACDVKPRVFPLPGDGQSVAFSADGGKLACAGRFDRVLLWDVASAEISSTLPLNTDQGARLAFASRSDQLVCVDERGEINLWNLKAPFARTTWMGVPGALRGAAFFSHDTAIATGGEDVRLWKVDGKVLGSITAPHFLSAFAFSCLGSKIALGTQDGRWQLGDLEGKSSLQINHAIPLGSIVFSADDRFVFTGDEAGAVIAWEAANGQRLFSMNGHRGLVRTLAVSPDGQSLASGGDDGMVWLWDLQRRRARVVLHGHSRPVLALAFSPDGQRLASTGADASLRLWEVQRLRAGEPLPAPVPAVHKVAFTADGKAMALACHDHSVRLVDCQTLRQTRQIAGNHAPIRDLAVSATGKHVVITRDDGQIMFGDIAKGEFSASEKVRVAAVDAKGERILLNDILCSFDFIFPQADKPASPQVPWFDLPADIDDLTFSPDGQVLAAISKGRIHFWNTSARSNERDPRQKPVDHPLEQAARRLAFCHQGKRFAVATATGEILLRDLEKPATLGKYEGPAIFMHTLAFSAKDRYLAGVDQSRSFFVWEGPSRRLVKRLAGVRHFAFAPAGDRMATVCLDGRVYVWDLATWSVRFLEGQQPGPVHSLAFSADGRCLITGSQETPAILKTFTHLPLLPKGNYDYRIPGSAAGAVRRWDLEQRASLQSIATPDWVNLHGLAGVSKSGLMAAGGHGGWIQCWKDPARTAEAMFFCSDEARAYWNNFELVRGAQWGTPNYAESVRAVAVAGQGNLVATVREKHIAKEKHIELHQTVQLWNPAGKELASFPGSVGIWGKDVDPALLRFSSDGSLLAYAVKHKVRLVDVVARSLLPRELEAGGAVRSLAFANGVPWLATGSSDRMIALWELRAGKVLASWSAHGDAVSALAFANDNKTLVSGSLDASVKLWSAPSGDFLGAVDGPTGKVHALAFSPAGEILASGGQTPFGAGEILIWRAAAKE